MNTLLFKIILSSVLLLIGFLLSFLNYIPKLNLALFPIFVLFLYLVYFPPKVLSGKFLQILIWFIALILGLFLAIYRPQGFDYPLIWTVPYLYEDGAPFSLYLNTCKALGGYLVILWLMKYIIDNSTKAPLPSSIALTSFSILVVILTASLAFDIGWQPKLPSGLIYFVIVNLFVTVVSEEAFFRLLIQKRVSLFFSNPTVGKWIGASLATLVFTLSHTASLDVVFVLYLIVGSIYSAVYAFTQRLEMAIACHFGVNILHITLLEYPLNF